MKLVQLIYSSHVAGELTLDTIKQILEKAVKNNSADNITGFLAFDQHNFLQVLEGGTTKVNQLFGRISRDGRHHSVYLISFREIEERSFPYFAMGDCNLESVDSSVIQRYTEGGLFNPGRLSAADALELLQSLEAERRREMAVHAL